MLHPCTASSWLCASLHREIDPDSSDRSVQVAIKDMHVRGAGLIGASAGFGMYLAALAAPRDNEAAFTYFVQSAGDALKATRPTAGISPALSFRGPSSELR